MKRILTALLAPLLFVSAPLHAVETRPDFLKAKYGFFVHYVWAGKGGGLTLDRNGNRPSSFDALADAFDVEGFAKDMAAWQVEYVIFTAWHANINPLFPSETMKKWDLPDHASKRDLIGEVIKALKAKGIAVWLYTHPRDGHDLHGEERVKTGWGKDGKGGDPDWNQFDYQKWNDFTNDLYAELVNRYGKDIQGVYLDEGSSAGDSHRVVDYPRLRKTIKGRQPHLLMMQNDYLHILNPPAGPQARIGMPANGVRFGKATLLTSGQPVKLDFDKAGYLVTLPNGVTWDKLNTVIRLEVSNAK